MDIAFVIRRRLEELGLEQRELARAAKVTQSYISQLLTRKRAPPAPNRTDIYGKMDRFLKLPPGELARLADLQRKEALKQELGEEPTPLFGDVRSLILRKCRPDIERQVRAIFEKQPFGELERLVTQLLLDVVKRAAREELENEDWLTTIAGRSGLTYEEMRVVVLEFLDTDIFHLSPEQCTAFLDPLVESWHMDLATFELDITLATGEKGGRTKRLQFIERPPNEARGTEPGFTEFLQDPLSASITKAETEFLARLRFADRRPTALYYYRELQNLRDPLHFRSTPAPSGRGVH